MIRKVKNTIPVYDICTLNGTQHLHSDIIAAPFGAYLAGHPNLHFPHRHSFYHIVLFTQGGGTHTIDFEEFAVQPGQIYFMIPGQVHTWSFEGDMDGYIINCSEALLGTMLQAGVFTGQLPFLRGVAAESVINMNAGQAAVAGHYMQAVIDEVRSKDRLTNAMITALLTALLVTVSRSVEVNSGTEGIRQNNLVLYNFRERVERQYATIRLPKEYAAQLFITPNHLNAVCHQLLGKAAGEVIRDRVLLEIKRLLVNVDIPVSGIAAQLSFPDNSYFTKFFKKYEGVTPEEFRKAHNIVTLHKNGIK